MKSFDTIHEQLLALRESAKMRKNDNVLLNLLEQGIQQDYFEKVKKASNALIGIYKNIISESSEIKTSVTGKIGCCDEDDLKVCLLIDVIRSYNGLNHPTTFNTPEGIALMVLFSNLLQLGEIEYYEDLENVDTVSLSLIDIIPFIEACSEEIGSKNLLMLSTIIETFDVDTDIKYRKLIYAYCKAVAEVDSVIEVSEKEWLETIARLDDDDVANDIDVSDLI